MYGGGWGVVCCLKLIQQPAAHTCDDVGDDEADGLMVYVVWCVAGVSAACAGWLVAAPEALLPCAGLPGWITPRLAQVTPAADAGADDACLCCGTVTCKALQAQVSTVCMPSTRRKASCFLGVGEIGAAAQCCFKVYRSSSMQ